MLGLAAVHEVSRAWRLKTNLKINYGESRGKVRLQFKFERQKVNRGLLRLGVRLASVTAGYKGIE